MNNKQLRINLIPPDIEKKRKAEKGILFLVLIIIVFIGFLISVSVLFGMKVSQEEGALAAEEAKTQSIEKKISGFGVYKERKEQIAKHEEVVRKVVENQLFWHKFLNELSMVIPQNVAISKLELTGSQISLSGATYNHQDVAEFLVRMSELDDIKNIWIDGSKDTEMEDAEVMGQGSDSNSDASKIVGVEFSLTADLKNARVDNAATQNQNSEANKG